MTTICSIRGATVAATLLLLGSGMAAAQTFESVGTRALGMGGAFVAVADDATATWWNPAGLATGSMVDVVLAADRIETRTSPEDRPPAARRAGTVIALTTPALGVSYYRLRLTDIQASGTTAGGGGSRQLEGGNLPLYSLVVAQLGVTVLQTVVPGVHIGTTVKYLRAGGAAAFGVPGRVPGDLLADADALETAGQSRFDLDVGLMASVGAVRVGATVKNVRQPTFEIAGSTALARLDRQVRAGVSVDAGALGGPPLVVALDADLRTVATPFGPRRNIALGAERWLRNRRIGVRSGLRVDTLGDRRPVGAGGLSVAVRSGLYVEGQASRGGDRADRGWSLGARVTF